MNKIINFKCQKNRFLIVHKYKIENNMLENFEIFLLNKQTKRDIENDFSEKVL